MRGARKGLTTIILMIAFGLVGLAIMLPTLQSAREKASGVYGAGQEVASVHSMNSQVSTMHAFRPQETLPVEFTAHPAEHEQENSADELVHSCMRHGPHRHISGLTDEEIQAITSNTAWTFETALVAVQDMELQAQTEGRDFKPFGAAVNGQRMMLQNAQLAALMVQHPGNKPGNCFSTEKLPPQAPEGSEHGCGCGATCDENGKPTNPENPNCKRACARAKCLCGTCF